MQVIQTAPATPSPTIALGQQVRSSSRNLWRGVNSVVLGAGPAHALHFATYEFCKEYYGANRQGHHPLASAAAGATATFAHDALMNPFDGKAKHMHACMNSVRERWYSSCASLFSDQTTNATG
jgi:solute carrier family 25 iron transporter 28/37